MRVAVGNSKKHLKLAATLGGGVRWNRLSALAAESPAPRSRGAELVCTHAEGPAPAVVSTVQSNCSPPWAALNVSHRSVSAPLIGPLTT